MALEEAIAGEGGEGHLYCHWITESVTAMSGSTRNMSLAYRSK